MTEHTDTALSKDILNPILETGLEGLPEAISLLINHAMLVERSQHVGVAPYQRNSLRNGYSNGFKNRCIESRLGAIELRIPQVRNSDIPFYPNALERGQRSEKALTISVAEMYLQGVSTRRVTHILEALCGLEVTSTQVSRAVAELDPMLEAWRNRPIPLIAHLILDARYEKVRVDGVVRSCAVFTAIGIRSGDGKRMILGTSVSLSEAEVHWRNFLSSLKNRGLLFPTGSITSDAHEGLKAALAAVFAGVPWNRCQFHLQQNAQAYVPKQKMKTSVATDIRSIFNAESLALATQKLAAAVEKYSTSAPKLAAWMEANLPDGFTVFSFPENIRQRLRTSNLCEMINKQIRRRTRVASIFPNEASCLRLVSAILMELSDDWESSNAYLNPQFLR
jgi:transposase-like protein